MQTLASLTDMAGIKNAVPEAARRVAARRAYLKKSGADIETETGGAIYAKLLYRLEKGEKQLKDLPYAKLRRLMYALEWTPEEFADAAGLELPTATVPGARPYSPRHEIPVYETVSAGLARTPSEDEIVGTHYLDPSLPGLRGRNVEKMVVVTVNGDSMASQDVMRDIPDGSMCVVEIGATPREGDVVIAWVHGHDLAVIKRYGEAMSVLTSYRPDGPVFRASDVEIDIRGVVRQVIRRL